MLALLVPTKRIRLQCKTFTWVAQQNLNFKITSVRSMIAMWIWKSYKRHMVLLTCLQTRNFASSSASLSRNASLALWSRTRLSIRLIARSQSSKEPSNLKNSNWRIASWICALRPAMAGVKPLHRSKSNWSLGPGLPSRPTCQTASTCMILSHLCNLTNSTRSRVVIKTQKTTVTSCRRKTTRIRNRGSKWVGPDL